MPGSEDVTEGSDDVREASGGQDGDMIFAGSSWYVAHKCPMGSITWFSHANICALNLLNL